MSGIIVEQVGVVLSIVLILSAMLYIVITMFLRVAVGGEASLLKDVRWAFRSWGNAGTAVAAILFLWMLVGVVVVLLIPIVKAYPTWPTAIQATIVTALITAVVIPLFRAYTARLASSVNQSILMRVDPVRFGCTHMFFLKVSARICTIFALNCMKLQSRD